MRVGVSVRMCEGVHVCVLVGEGVQGEKRAENVREGGREVDRPTPRQRALILRVARVVEECKQGRIPELGI